MNASSLDLARATAIVDLAQAHGMELSATGSRTWELPALSSSSRVATVSIRGSWLHFESPLARPRHGGPPRAQRARHMLRRNASLPAGVNYCLGLRTLRPMLCGDFALDEQHVNDDDLATQVAAACDAFCQTLACTDSRLSSDDRQIDELLQKPLHVDDDRGEIIRTHCDSAGWTYIERGNGQLAITLDVPDHFCQAYAYRAGEREVRLGTLLDLPSELGPPSRHAVNIFLLTASRRVRMARVAMVGERSDAPYRWEVAWPDLPNVSQFHSGLSALLIACRLSVNELQAFGDESIANSYLQLRGCSWQ